ncbi:unnamed protein product [Aureobasidium vineae]|uniref:Uncharacterized protein n=1 Tax=Aureobasidium vineae TaxID=2773715 RepID=A0A9N8JQ52_9PEZI|nr:unnamed protein product [Aureobasidium vineae]
MPTQTPHDKSWEGMPLHRLMQFRSLSEAPEFSVYLINKRNVRSLVNKLQHELPKTLSPVNVDLDKVYEGRGGAWDAWGSYSHELVGVQKPKLLESTGDLITVVI